MIKIPQSSVDRFKEYVDQVVASGNLAEGEFRKRIEDHFSTSFRVNSSTLVNSNGSGILACLAYYKNCCGKTKVLIQSNTMYGMSTVPRVLGMELEVVASNLHTFTMDPYQLEYSLQKDHNSQNLVVLMSHIGGQVSPDIEKLRDICKKYHVPMIEDGAHTLGAQHHLYGDALVFSFYSTKALPAGESGLVISDDKSLNNYVKRFIMYDRIEMTMSEGVNLRVSEIQAAFIWAVLQDQSEIVLDRIKTWNIYRESCLRNHITFMDYRGSHNAYKFIITDESAIRHFNNFIVKKGEYSGNDILTGTVFGYTLARGCMEMKHVCLNTNYQVSPSILDQTLSELETIGSEKLKITSHFSKYYS